MTFKSKRAMLPIIGLAGLSFLTAPAVAADLPGMASPLTAYPAIAVHSGTTADSSNYYRHRRYRYRHRRGPNVGDVLTGILILGTIGAIIDAVDNDDRGDDYRRNDRDYRGPREIGYESARESRGLDRAIDQCVAAIERDTSVASVDEANRTGTGWQIDGQLTDGSRFACAIDNRGRISDLEFYDDGPFDRDDYSYRDDTYGQPLQADLYALETEAERQGWTAGRQYDDATYARLRSR